MRSLHGATLLAVAAFAALASNAYAELVGMPALSSSNPVRTASDPDSEPRVATALPYTTGFEAVEGSDTYALGNLSLAANGGGRWVGDGQTTGTAWTITNAVTNGGPSAGSNWVIANTTSSTFNWTYVNPVVTTAVSGSSDVKLAAPASGTTNRSTSAGLQMYTSAIDVICQINLLRDTENLYGLGANRMLVELTGGVGGVGDAFAYDLGPSAIGVWANLRMDVNFATNTCVGYLGNVALPDVVSAGGYTDFHDLDMFTGRRATTGGTADRGGFDNYHIGLVPEPTSLALLALGGLFVARRRKQA